MITQIQMSKGSRIDRRNYFDKTLSADICIANVQIFQLGVADTCLVPAEYFQQGIDGLLLT